MKVLKFGGSSVSSADRIKHVVGLIKSRCEKKEELCLVFSALGGVTDQLIQAADEAANGKVSYVKIVKELKSRHFSIVEDLLGGAILKITKKDLEENFKVLNNLLKGVFLVREASPRTMDYILSFGERNSNYLIAAYFNFCGIKADYIDARKLIKTNKEYGQAKVNFPVTNDLIKNHFVAGLSGLQIITGFIASDVGGLTTTLGRGGSDYTASIIAGAIKALSLEIWTDVDGVLTANPKIVKNAYTIPQLSYDEAMEMSHFGAKVIYPPTIQPAFSQSVPIYIKNTFNPTFPGTLISKLGNQSSRKKITGISSISNIALMTLEGSGLVGIPGTAARLFSCLGKNKVNIIMITQASSEHSICFAVNASSTKIALAAIHEEFEKEKNSELIKPVKVENQLSLIAVIGENMKKVPGVAGSLFKSLGHNGINVVAIAQGSSELNISFAIKQEDEQKALNLVHDAFFLSENKRVNVYLAGIGLIGSTLLKQINEQRETLLKEKNLDIRIVGIANSRLMAFRRNGLDIKDWKSRLHKEGQPSSFNGIVNMIKDFNLPNSIFVDCTANVGIKEIYPRILSLNVSISSANKSAASSAYSEYSALKSLAQKNNVQFLFETNVGAGLPILSTLAGLIESGDKIDEIQAVISGSLSYIFNNYAPNKSFKELIMEARKLGYTEPDPRDDLSGLDIKRKIIILCRVAGYQIEPEDVEVEAILPTSCMEAKSINDFFGELEKHEDHFRLLINSAFSQNAKLRYLATFSNGKAAIRLKMVTSDSPFYNLASTDNMIVFRTARYRERPLIIQGPGAGADVTAAGVFAEIIQQGNMIL